jgi:RHS repeat-associated protein
MTDKGANTLNWDADGLMISGLSRSLTYNWDSKLRSVTADANTVDIRYDPDGNRVLQSVTTGTTANRKYVVDTEGELPTILLEIDPSVQDPNQAIVKTYIYANSQIIAQHDGYFGDPMYFYLHDRLGSVREVIDTSAAVVNTYTYEPFGQSFSTEVTQNVANPWQFTGQYFDSEFNQYFLRARQYDPAIYRFTARDPVIGKQREPLSLHKYLYTLNDPINAVDPTGEVALNIANGLEVATTIYSAGLTVAAVGAEYGNIELIVAGGIIQQLSGLGFAIGVGGVCFVEGTEISTPFGYIPIEEIEVGSYVWAANSDTGEPSLFKVVKCFERETDELVVITVDSDQIETTYDHPFYVYDYGWQRAGELKVGANLVDIDGNPVRITNIAVVSGKRKVYNFEVADSHTYYVSNASLLVHNFCALKPDKFRRTANNLAEELAMKEAMSNPLYSYGDINPVKTWPGFEKFAQNVNGVEIHYVRNIMTGIFGDFKFSP